MHSFITFLVPVILEAEHPSFISNIHLHTTPAINRIFPADTTDFRPLLFGGNLAPELIIRA